MSADNWGACPACSARMMDKKRKLVEKLEAAYGQLPEREYLALREKVAQPVKVEYTLREDWDVFTDGKGEFVVDYRCHCTACGFAHEFKHGEQLIKRDR